MLERVIIWGIFGILIIGLLWLDLRYFHRKSRVIKVKEALWLSAFWIGLALLFNLGIYFWRGQETAMQFLTGFLLEKFLSVDNIFIFLLIFSFFRVPSMYRHKILFWGIFGALIMRAIFIGTGITLLNNFKWLNYILGAFLVAASINMILNKTSRLNLSNNPAIRLLRRIVPIMDSYEPGTFFVRKDGRLFATSLFIVLLVIETTDIIFATDSIPTVLAITSDPFIVYSSNIFAMLGLRALFFALSGVVRTFHYLRYGLATILIFTGIKMIFNDIFPIPIHITLIILLAILFCSILISVIRFKYHDKIIKKEE